MLVEKPGDRGQNERAKRERITAGEREPRHPAAKATGCNSIDRRGGRNTRGYITGHAGYDDVPSRIAVAAADYGNPIQIDRIRRKIGSIEVSLEQISVQGLTRRTQRAGVEIGV